MNLQKTRSL